MFFSEWNTMTLWEMGFGLFLRIRWEYLYCSFISMVSMKLQPVGDKHTVCWTCKSFYCSTVGGFLLDAPFCPHKPCQECQESAIQSVCIPHKTLRYVGACALCSVGNEVLLYCSFCVFFNVQVQDDGTLSHLSLFFLGAFDLLNKARGITFNFVVSCNHLWCDCITFCYAVLMGLCIAI